MACKASFAQKAAQLSGKITGENNEPLAHATVKLNRLPDTSVLKKAETDVAGKFILANLPAGKYALTVSRTGYETAIVNTLMLAGEDLELPLLRLQSITRQLKELTIQGRKPYVERKIDKTILNVEGSILSAGSTALEVLEKAPGVTLDRQNDQIKLNNKTGITVMIDGKTNFLSGTDITTILGNMSSDQIATIELITNPSSKYDAAGNAGIINIKLKRNKAYGTNGSLSLNTGEGIQPYFPADTYRAGLSLNLNHRINKWSIYGTAAFNRKVNYNTINVVRTTATSTLSSAFDQNFQRNNTGKAYMGKVGADYYANEKLVFGIMVDASAIRAELNNNSQTYIKERQSGLETFNSVNQLANSGSPINNITANMNMRYDLDKNGKSLTFDADYSNFDNRKQENFDAEYFNQSGAPTNSTRLRNFTGVNIDIYAAKTDFTLPLNKTVKLEMGLKSSKVITNNELIAEKFISSNWENDLGRSNHFIYKENINAAYTNFSKEWKKWQFQAGLRLEHTHSNGNSITANSAVKRNYLSVFPTIFLSQDLGKDQHIRYSFSRRVDRPNYQQLNPFVFYMDPYALDEGNPYLKPQFTSNFEIGYNFKEIGITVNYSTTRDMITQISQQNEVTRIVNVIRKNLGHAQNLSFNLYVPLSVKKYWNVQNNFSLYYNKFDDPNLEGAKFSANKLSFNFNTTHSLTLPANFSLELNYWLNSPAIRGVEQTTIVQHALNAGLQKAFLEKKLKVRLGMDDIFLTNYWKGQLQYQNVNLHVVNHYLSRRASFTVNYNFGNQNVKSARKRGTATDDIKNRASQ